MSERTVDTNKRASVMDMTAFSEPPESVGILAKAWSAAPGALVILDSFGTLWFANDSACSLFGYSAEDLIGAPITQLMSDRDGAPSPGQEVNDLACPETQARETQMDVFGRRRDGTEFPMRFSVHPLPTRGGALRVACILDITEREQLEAELSAVRAAANRAKEAADRASQAKSQFLAAASHDLRQPLQALALLNGSLRRLVADSTGVQALTQQQDTIAAMSRLVNALLDISKLESGAITPDLSDFKVAAVFDELRKEFAALALTKGLELRVEASAECVRSDLSLVEQMLRNLLANAIKYTAKGWVALRCLSEASGIRIEVLDTGIGIPADQLPYIFDEFYQVNRPQTETRDGYGLGLSIVQRVAKLLGVLLDVESEVGQGSRFSLWLPTSAGPASAMPPRPDRPTPEKLPERARRIMLVEDDPGVRASLKLLLDLEGYQVITAASRTEALQRISGGERPELLVTDYHLEGSETGIDVIAAAREVLGTPVPAILMSGDTSSAIRHLPPDERRQLLSKPADANELLALMRSVLAP